MGNLCEHSANDDQEINLKASAPKLSRQPKYKNCGCVILNTTKIDFDQNCLDEISQ